METTLHFKERKEIEKLDSNLFKLSIMISHPSWNNEIWMPFRPFVSISSIKKLSLDLSRARQSIQPFRLSLLNHDILQQEDTRIVFHTLVFFFFFLRYDYSETNLTIIQWSSFAKNKKKKGNPTFERNAFFFFPTTEMKPCRTLNILLYPPLWKTFNRLKSLDLYLLSIGEIDLKKKLLYTYIYIYIFLQFQT